MRIYFLRCAIVQCWMCAKLIDRIPRLEIPMRPECSRDFLIGFLDWKSRCECSRDLLIGFLHWKSRCKFSWDLFRSNFSTKNQDACVSIFKSSDTLKSRCWSIDSIHDLSQEIFPTDSGDSSQVAFWDIRWEVWKKTRKNNRFAEKYVEQINLFILEIVIGKWVSANILFPGFFT